MATSTSSTPGPATSCWCSGILARPRGSGGYTPRIAFSPDGSRIAGYGMTTAMNVWDLGISSALATEPEANDLAGWLRRSRALADHDDVAGAEAALARARALPKGEASPWIEHALSLWRQGARSQARDAFYQAKSSLPDDSGRWIELGRLLLRFGWSQEAEAVFAKAGSLLEFELSRAPDAEAVAAALAEVLPEEDASRGWTILYPDVMTSAAGAKLTRLPDGSVLAGGLNSSVDTYTVEATTSLSGITGLRLEALPDPSLPYFGPGRHNGNGSFRLDAVRFSAVLEPRAPARWELRLTGARADYPPRNSGPGSVIDALDADPATSWDIWPQAGRAHRAIFQVAEPFRARGDTRLRVELSFRTGAPQHTLGRFRLSITDRPILLIEPILMRLKDDAERNGLLRLGAAYSLLGDWASAASVLERADAREGASALEGFLLALARHHLGRHDEAQSDCDRYLERRRTEPAEDATRDVAAEALTTIRGLSASEAESLLLDAAFPADPFAP
jgi:tetratricopeptide (TPR) repeat protein